MSDASYSNESGGLGASSQTGGRSARPPGGQDPRRADETKHADRSAADRSAADRSGDDRSGGGAGGGDARHPGTNTRPGGFDSHAISPDHRTDEQLLSAYRAGERNAFAILVARYQRELFHFLVRFLGDRAAAEDVFQETFLQVHQSMDQFDPQRRFRPWLFTIAANKARDLIRSQARRPTNPLQATINPSDDESGEFMDLMSATQDFPDQPMQRQELQEMVQRTVMSMPEHLREILLLSYFHQFPYKQISDILDIPLGTVKSRLHAAVAHFADRWKALNQKESSS